MLLKSLFFSISTVLLVSCASKQDFSHCTGLDWYEAGRRDGAKGAEAQKPEALGSKCGFTDSSESYRLYVQGRNAGLSEYCTSDNAFHIGKTNLPYTPGTCPKLLEEQFLAAINKGRMVNELESQNIELEKQIETLAGVTQRSPASHSKAKSELRRLQESKRKNENKIKQLVN